MTRKRRTNDYHCFSFDFLYLDMTEEEKLIAELGKPKLGEKNSIRVRIRESKEFKVYRTKKNR